MIEGFDPEPVTKQDPAPAEPAESDERVVRVRPRELADIGAIISGASLLLAPQSFADTGYTILAAFAAGIPVLHADHPAVEELALDAGVAVESSGMFAAELTRILEEEGELERLRVLARDRARSFSWHNTAWQLWETHANL